MRPAAPSIPAAPRRPAPGAPAPAPAAARVAAAMLAAATLAAPVLAGAQDVGYTPDASPYRDLVYRQEVTAFAGYYAASRDPVGVAPRGGPMAGLRYEFRVGGPAYLYARAGLVRSERQVLDPFVPMAARDAGIRKVNLLLADVGLAINVTGQKSWHGLVPVVQGGLGVASDFDERDVGGFRLGTPFALSFGGGMRWVPGGNLQVRVDVTDHMYQVKYPSTYYLTPAPGETAIRERTEKENVWKHNAALTIGASYLFFR